MNRKSAAILTLASAAAVHSGGAHRCCCFAATSTLQLPRGAFATVPHAGRRRGRGAFQLGRSTCTSTDDDVAHTSLNLGEMAEADRRQLLRQLLEDAKLLHAGAGDDDPVSAKESRPFDVGYDCQTLGRGFCNWVYRVTPTAAPTKDGPAAAAAVVVKVFSDLARVRVPDDVLGSIDVLASDHDIGPRVLHRGRNGIVMEHIDRAVLTEEDVHGMTKRDGLMLCEAIGSKLARLHSTPIPSNLPMVKEVDNMLWKTLQAMLDFVGDDAPIPPAVLKSGWTHDRLRQEVQSMRQQLDALDLPVVLCHGDFKPSNILVIDYHISSDGRKIGDVVLIDYELSGPGYRGFDFYKLFRTANSAVQNDENMVAFVRSYLRSEQSLDSQSSSAIDSATVDRVLSEMKLFEPLTWLEAGIFFLFAAKGDPTQVERWENLALDRFDNFDASKSRFEANLEEYMKAQEMKKPK
jgi:thiamine kinase-like enzyme